MRIFPVIDILNGSAVHAVGGHRQLYRPVQSVITDSSEPCRLLRAMQKRLRIAHCYVADIDAIQGRPLHREVLAEMKRTDVALTVDCGIQAHSDIEPLLELGIDRIVVGSETVCGPDVIRGLSNSGHAARLVFSIDMRDGALLTPYAAWRELSALEVALQVAEFGITQFIVLDLAAIGTGRGVPSLALCRELRSHIPRAGIIAGGGVRTLSDLCRLEEAGADGALVATAFHNGSLTAEDLRRFEP